MDFNDSAEEAAFRAEARAWLAAHAPAHELPVGAKMPDTEEADRGRAWLRALYAGGWSGLTFPTEQIGSATWRERVRQYMDISVVAAALTKKYARTGGIQTTRGTAKIEY